MALQLTGTWEQALLTSIAQTAAQHEPEGQLGKVALQKILYFLQISGVPMRYRFELYHYGPFCDTVSRDVEWLLADGVLEDSSPEPDKYSNYHASGEAGDLMEIYRRELNACRMAIEAVVKALLPLRPDHLELLATLDYLFRQLRAGGGEGPWKDRVIERFMGVKKGKFLCDRVSSAYDALARVGLIEA